MRVVLGIDAAWTERQPSGVALVVDDGTGWRLLAAEASYGHFISVAHGNRPHGDPVGTLPNAHDLIEAARLLAGQAPDLVAIDMPLSREPITERRCADTAISLTFGAQWCSTHTPSTLRPGKISDDLSSGFAALGYPLCTETIVAPGLIEVYPHPALVRLTDEPKRLPYKVAKASRYWPKSLPEDRRLALLGEWGSIATVLEAYVKGTDERLMASSILGTRPKNLKAREDMIDAVICCVVGIRALDGKAQPFGNSDAAIWVPERDEAMLERILLPSSPYSRRAEMQAEVFADALARGEYSERLNCAKHDTQQGEYQR